MSFFIKILRWFYKNVYYITGMPDLSSTRSVRQTTTNNSGSTQTENGK